MVGATRVRGSLVGDTNFSSASVVIGTEGWETGCRVGGRTDTRGDGYLGTVAGERVITGSGGRCRPETRGEWAVGSNLGPHDAQ